MTATTGTQAGGKTEVGGKGRVRKGLAALTLAAAVALPGAALTASPAHAVGGSSCPEYWCGNGNHNERGERDDEDRSVDSARPRGRNGVVALALAVAAAAPLATGGGHVVSRIALNHNETAGRDQ